MNNIASKRCFNHSTRGAVARCPECTRYFCRECITEYRGKVICSRCLKKLADSETAQKFSFKLPLKFIESLIGIILAWLFFFIIGQGLLMIPHSFHEGTIWKENNRANGRK
jgi:uncharacterized paraquat-inducible protein A